MLQGSMEGLQARLIVMGKSQETPPQADACLQEIEPSGSISPKRPKGAAGFGSGSPIMACFLRMFHIRQDAPQLAAGFFTYKSSGYP